MTEYFISINNKKTGPYTLESKGIQNITGETLIWRKGLDEWTKAKDLSELNDILSNMPPPIPNQSSNKFGEYLKHNFKYILLTFGISLVVGYYIHENYWDYAVETQFNGRTVAEQMDINGFNYTEKIIFLRDLYKFIVWSIGILLVPFLYLFKKK